MPIDPAAFYSVPVAAALGTKKIGADASYLLQFESELESIEAKILKYDVITNKQPVLCMAHQ